MSLNYVNEAGIARLQAAGCDLVLWDDPAVGEWPERADGVIVREGRITGAELARAVKVRGIAKHGVGCDNIDLAAAKAKGIPVMNIPGVNSEAVAELSIALGLAAARRVAKCDRYLREGREMVREDFYGIGFQNKTVGVIGLGNIGGKVAKKWHGAFDMTVLGYDPWITDEAVAALPFPVTRCATLEEMLPRIDLLSIHIPLTPESRHLINAERLALMKPDALVVSAARGGIIDETALYDALKGGTIWGAALDVFEQEPPPADHPLFSLPEFVGTYHIAGTQRESRIASGIAVAERLINVLDGGVPESVVNP
jgi:D-3-phosphoglycerate dehydrogenase